METNQPNNNNGALKAALAVTLLLLGFLGYLLYDSKLTTVNQEQVINQKVEQLASAKSRLDSVSAQLDAKIAEIKSLGGKVDELEAAKAQLEKDKIALKKNSNFSSAKYNDKIKNYIALLAEKDQEIARLKQENETLTAQNQTLSQEKESLSKEKEGVIKENDGLKTDKEKLNATVQDYSAKNEFLSDKVKKAADLKAEGVKVFAVTSKGKTKESGKYRAKKVDKLKVVFNLPPNPVAENDSKEIVMRVLDPDGAVISDSSMGSGVFNFNGKELAFTSKEQISYTNNNQTVEMLYAKGSPYRSGKYNVELYAEGFKIGEGGFVIK